MHAVMETEANRRIGSLQVGSDVENLMINPLTANIRIMFAEQIN